MNVSNLAEDYEENMVLLSIYDLLEGDEGREPRHEQRSEFYIV
jgi:hypothetical protein